MHRSPRPGEEWRLPNGNEVIVEEVVGTSVNGAARPAAITSSGGGRGTVGVAAFAGSVDAFERAVLIGPRWRIKLTAPAPGSHPSQDPVFDAITRVAEIEHMSQPMLLPDEPDVIRAHEASYDVFVLAPSEGDARETVRSAAEAAGHGEPTIVETERAPNL